MNRWWIYQKERFPIAKNGLLIAIFSTSAVGYSLLLRTSANQPVVPSLGLIILAFVALFLFFLQLQVIDEFRAIQKDVLYNPSRPVPRGLVSLQELKLIGFAVGLIQLGLALSIGGSMVFLLLLVWAYLALMAYKFFVPRWLAAHLIVDGLSHIAAFPLFALYATAHDWLAVGLSPASGIIWFLLLSFLSQLAIELGRWLRTSQGKTTKDKDATSKLQLIQRYRQAVLIWLSVVWLMVIVSLQAGVQIHFAVPVTVIVLTLLTVSVGVAWRCWMNPSAAKHLELMAGLLTIAIYFNLGILPLILKS